MAGPSGGTGIAGLCTMSTGKLIFTAAPDLTAKTRLNRVTIR